VGVFFFFFSFLKNTKTVKKKKKNMGKKKKKKIKNVHLIFYNFFLSNTYNIHKLKVYIKKLK